MDKTPRRVIQSNPTMLFRYHFQVTNFFTKLLLAEPRNLGELLLGQTLLLPEALDVLADQPSHIHAQEVSGLHPLSLSTIGFRTMSREPINQPSDP
jgi:hypothetical protein